MKIAFFTDTYYPQINGVTVSIENYARSLRKRGHTVYIFAPKLKGYGDTDEYVQRLTSLKILSSEPEARIPVLIPNSSLRRLFRLNFDIVHAHGNGVFSFLGYEVSRVKGTPFIMTFHTLHTKYTHYILKGRLLRPGMVASGLRVFANLCDSVITPSAKMEQELRAYGVRKPIYVVPNFIQASAFEGVEKGYLHKLLGLGTSERLILTVGRLGKEKNFDFVIKVFAQVAKKQAAAHLVVVGNGPEKRSLVKLSQELKIASKVHFPGNISTAVMPKVYADAELFVFASTTETQGICVLEAATARLPLVVADDSAYDKVVLEGVNGFRLPLNQRVFAEKITSILDNREWALSLGKNSAAVAKKNFDEAKLIGKMEDCYQETIEKYGHKERIVKRIINRTSLIRLLRATEALNKFFNYVK